MDAQQLIINQLVPVTTGIIVLWLAYQVLFNNSNRLKFNRIYLLTALLFSLALPFIGMQMGQSSPQMVSLKQDLFGGAFLNEIIVTPEGQTALPEAEATTETASQPRVQLGIWQFVGGVYIIGVAAMLLLYFIKVGKLVVLIVRSPKEKREGYTAVFTGKAQGSFSFFRYAFFPDENVAPDIVRHELSHIAHHHSWDILFAEVMMILQWFNPFVYKYKKELQSLHEYQADRDVVATGVDKRDYMMLILQQCTAADFSGMSNNFSLILTKKRIKMITRNEKAKGLWWRLLATLPVLAILMIANTKVTAQEQQADNKPITVEMGKFEIYDDDGHSFQFMDTVIYNEDGSYVQCVTSDTDILDPNTGKPLKAMTITTHNADGTPRGNMKLHWEMHGDTTQYTAEPFSITEESLNILMDGLSTLVDRPDNDSIYNIVEQMPQFPGGNPAMFEYISKNVKYPQKAKDEGIQGRVFIQFVVEKDGSVGEVKLLRGIGGGCDEEGIRVVKSMPKWTPGQQAGKAVRVLYTLPIFFKLDDQTPQPNNKGDMQPDKNGVYQIAEEMPRFPGDDKALMVYLQKNLIMPEKYKGNTDENPSLAEYRTFVKFVVNEDGSISDIQLLRKSAEFKDLDEEAIRVVKSMPNWEPGKKEGKPVKVYFNLPIVFKFRK